MRETFLPQLPDTTLLVLAGRHRPNMAWNSDAGWGEMARALELRNLDHFESRDFLIRRGVPQAHHDSILEFTHGHPLALVLVADLSIQGDSLRFEPMKSPDVVRALLERIVQDVPGAYHRQALEACAVVRVMTESLLTAMLKLPQNQVPDAYDLFKWLQGLSFMEATRSGIAPHDLAREVLDTELGWRNPDQHLEFLQRASTYYEKRLQKTTGQEQRALLHNHVFLHRNSPAVRPFFEWQEIGYLVPGVARKNELTELAGIVARNEGKTAARLFADWSLWQPERVTVVRETTGKIVGLAATIALHEATEEQIESDPASRAIWDYMQRHAPLQAGEGSLIFRFWMAHDSYQSPSPTQSLIFLTIMQQLLTTPDLAFTTIVCEDVAFWEPIFAYTNMARLPLDFEIDGKSYGTFGHDWRVMPSQTWVALLSAMDVTTSKLDNSAPRTNAPTGLSHEEFAHEVRAVLRKFQSPSALYETPLLRSQLVSRRAPSDATIAQRVDELQAIIKEACREIEASPREAKSYRALHHTYFEGASTQEQVADLLDLPFSTYRRYLVAGIARLIEILWHSETDV